MEADHLTAFGALCQSVNIQISAMVAPCNQRQLTALPIDQVQIGDLSDLHQLAEQENVDLLLANSHANSIAKQMNIPLLRVGIPIHDQFGCFSKSFIGYTGLRDTLFELANLLRHEVHSIPVYHSTFKQTLNEITVPEQA